MVVIYWQVQFQNFSGKSHEDAEIVLRILDNVLVQRYKRVTQHRLLAFTKRLATLATQTMHNGTLGCLGTLKRIIQVPKLLIINLIFPLSYLQCQAHLMLLTTVKVFIASDSYSVAKMV